VNGKGQLLSGTWTLGAQQSLPGRYGPRRKSAHGLTILNGLTRSPLNTEDSRLAGVAQQLLIYNQDAVVYRNSRNFPNVTGRNCEPA